MADAQRTPIGESPMAQELIGLGIIDPGTSAARLSIYTYVCAANLPPEEKERRVSYVKALQIKYIGKEVKRIQEPDRKGTVKWISINNRNLLLANSTPEASSFQVFVAWKNGQKSPAPLNLIELC